jgi:hypothetical protein
MKCLTVPLGALLALGLSAATPAFAGDDGSRALNDCYKCPAPKKYDSQEVVKTSRETKSVAPSRRVIESNHLIIRENETRNVGTIQHNHTVIEKELVLTKRNVDTKTVDTVVNLVEHKYNTQRQRIVEQRELPGTVRDLRDCNCDGPRAIRAYGMAAQ